MDGNVYFIACSEPPSIKVGFTKNHPVSRLRQLQTGCPTRLDLLGWYPASILEEWELHAELAHLRLTGEWFRMDESMNDILRAPFELMHINNRLTGYDA
jgi:hypothetical protein